MAVLKKPGEDRPPTRLTRRLWTVAPAPMLPASTFDGYGIIEENPSPTGLVLFRWFRAVHLWVTTDPTSVGSLFEEADASRPCPAWVRQSVPQELCQQTAIYDRVATAPASVVPADLAAACAKVSEWASEGGNVVTATAFIEAAAWLQPDNPDLIFRAGRANRHSVAYGRAGLWFQRGIDVSRRSGNWTSYIDCLLGWGNLEIARGRFGEARRLLARAYRTARKYNIRELGAAAQHDLFVLCVDEKRFDDAYQHASAALNLYSNHDAPFPYLVHDLAQTFALDRYGVLALPLLTAVRPLIDAPSSQVQIAGNIAGAAGLAGDLDRFYDAWEEVSRLATRPAPYVAAALISVAEGAHALHLTRQAIEAASKGYQFAQQRQEATEERRATELLEKLRLGTTPAPSRDPPERIRELADVLLDRLRKRTDRD